MSSGAVRAGKVYVEIGADPKAFFRALNQVNRSIGQMGQNLISGGTKMAAFGVGMAAPIVAAVRQGVAFESTLLNIRASTNATAGEIDKIKTAAMDMSQALGVGPTEAAQGMLELLKAGVPLETVLNGAGRAALEFSKVAGLDGAVAATVMSKAMNAFGVDATTAANSMSAAADASATSVEEMAQAFSQASAVASTSNQGINDLSAALAVLANKGIVGSDAGTSIKTMLQKLKVPTNDAASALAKVGLTFASFRGADGQLLPLVDIIKTLERAIGGVDQATRDDVLGNVFGSDAIRAASILTTVGSSGFNDMKAAMDSALPVGEKFQILMSGLAGAGSRILAGLQRLSIVIAGAVGPALAEIVPFITGAIDGFTKFAQNNREAVVGFAKLAVGAISLGGAMVGLGLSLQLTSFGFAGVGKALAVLLSPLSLVARGALAAGQSFASAVPGVFQMASAFGQAIVASATFAARAAASAGSYVASLTMMAAATASRLGFVAATWVASGIAIAAGFLAHVKALITYYTGALAGLQAITIARAGAMAAAWLASIGGVDTFGNALKSTLSMSNRVVASTVAAVTPAIGFIAKGFAALASDAARLAAPLAQPFIQAGTAVASFATGVASSIAAYVTSVATAAATTITSNAQIAAAWAGNALKSVWAFASGAVGGIAAYLGSVGGAVAASVGGAAAIAGAWIATAFPATAAFVSQAVASLAAYIASVAASLAASVTSAAGIAIAWVGSGMPGLAAFVGSAVAGLGSYLAACAVAVAGSVASAAAVAAAWLAPAAPLLALAGVIAGAGALAYSFGGELKGAMAGIGEMAGQAGAAIGSTFGTVLGDATAVFGDLFATATTTFNGIYDAIVAGDLSSAMDILWAGLQAGWLRGVEALMSYVDPWMTAFQDAFTIMGAEIYKGWDALWVSVGSAVNTAGAYLMGAFDNIINPILASWDTLEAGILKSWNYIQSFFKKGFDLKKENEKVDNAMAARKRKRELERPGIEGRATAAKQDNTRAERAMIERRDAVDAATQGTIAGREAANQQRADERRQGVMEAEARLADLTAGSAMKREDFQAIPGISQALAAVESLSELGSLGQQISGIIERDTLTAEQEQKLMDEYNAAAVRLNKEAASPGDQAAQAAAGAEAAGEQSRQSMGAVAGTFSSLNLGSVFGGTSLAERTARAAEETAKNTRKIDDGGKVAA